MDICKQALYATLFDGNTLIHMLLIYSWKTCKKVTNKENTVTAWYNVIHSGNTITMIPLCWVIEISKHWRAVETQFRE